MAKNNNDVIMSRDALTFLNLDAPQTATKVSTDSSIENQINKGMQDAIHEYLVKNWSNFYKFISTDAFGVDKHKTNGDVVHTKDDTPRRLEGVWRVVLPTNNGTTVKGNKVGQCFRLGLPQTYLKGLLTEACCYYTVDGITYYYDEKGEVITSKKSK